MSATIDAFVRRVLADPADRTARLVFADYLEEQGDAAWANYLRLRVELADAHAGARRQLQIALRRVERELGMRLTLDAAEFVPRFGELLDLLPATSLRIALGDDFNVPRDILGGVTGQIAIEWRGLPLGLGVVDGSPAKLVGMVHPSDQRAVHGFTCLGPGSVVAVTVPGDQLSKLVDRTFTRVLALARPSPTEVTATRVVLATPAEFETASESRQYLESLITEARANGWGGIELVAEVSEYQLYRLERGRPIRWHRLTREVGNELARVALLLSGERLGVRVSPRPTYFGPGVRVLILAQTPATVPGN